MSSREYIDGNEYIDETTRVENWNISNIVRCFKKYKVEGHGEFEAIDFYEQYKEQIDWHDLENLLARGCKLETAVKILV